MVKKFISCFLFLTTFFPFNTFASDNKDLDVPLSKSTLSISDDEFSDFTTSSSLRDSQEKGKKFILSLDGGGIRGIIIGVILTELEKELGGPVGKYFDVFGGTSTGGIYAAGLNIPADFEGTDPDIVATYDPSYGSDHPKFSAEDILNLYEERGSRIFKKRWFHWFKNSKYSRQGIDELAFQFLGDMPMGKSLNPLLLTTYDMSRARPFLMQSHIPDIKIKTLSSLLKPKKTLESRYLHGIHSCLDPNNPMFLMRDAVRATTAAPTFFQPVKIYSIDNQAQKTRTHYTMVDGGMYANNPVLATLEYARLLYPETPVNNYVVLSIGTGEANTTYSYEGMSKWNMLNWLNPAIETMMDGSSDMAHMIADSLLNSSLYGSGTRYYRFNDELAYATHSLDDYSKENIDNLKQDAYAILENREDEMTEIVRHIENEKDYI